MLVGSLSAAFAQTASPPASVEAVAPFGALSLFVLAATLFAGLVTGAGVASLRNRQPSFRKSGPRTAQNTDRRAVGAHPVIERTPPSPSRERLPPVVAVLGLAGTSDYGDWLDSLANGPRFGPRIVGFVAAEDCDKADAIACTANLARSGGHDVVVIDACGETDDLAKAFDRRIGRRARRTTDPFGAGARIEVLTASDLFGPSDVPTTAHWRDTFATLAARNDVVLVDLPGLAELAEVPSLYAALDEVVVLRDAAAPREQVSDVCAAARQSGVRITQQVVMKATCRSRLLRQLIITTGVPTLTRE